jgi:hypothetical protein
MLVETKAITEMGLVFGNTWQVIAIASILTMAFLAYGIVQFFRASRPYLPYLLLFASHCGRMVDRQGGRPALNHSWKSRNGRRSRLPAIFLRHCLFRPSLQSVQDL